MTDPTSATHWMAAFEQTGPYTVHGVGHSEEVVQAVEAAAWALGMPLARIDGSTIADTDDLLVKLGKEMAFPYPCRDWNVLIDMLSSLDEYMPGKPGYVLLVEHADALPKARRMTFENTFGNLVEILPNVSDRWQTIGPRFHVVLTGSQRMRTSASRLVGKRSESLREGYNVSWRVRAGMTFHASALLDHGDVDVPGPDAVSAP